MKSYIPALLIGSSIIITSLIFSNAFLNRNKSANTISVTGLGKKDFTSDLIVWKGSFTRKNMVLKEAYSQLDNDREVIKNYLTSNGVPESQIVFFAVDINKEYTDSYNENTKRRTREFSGFRLRQSVQVESDKVDDIESISRKVSELINQGVEFYSNAPEYYYTQLAELKISMIAEATQDARVRAEQIAENSGGILGGVTRANMGVFQIIAQNSSEDFSWGGSFNTSSKKKTATITMKLQYEVK